MVVEHRELIEALGGAKVLSDTIRRRTGKHITRQAVTLWKTRGIAWKHRQLIARIAGESNVAIPANFTIA